MRKIGDYVHLFAKRYNEFGIARNEDDNTTNEDIKTYDFNKQKQIIKQKCISSNINVDTLEKSLNEIFSSKKRVSKKVSKIRQTIKNELRKEFKEKMGNIDWATGNITKQYSDALREKNYIYKQYKDIDKRQYVQLHSIQNRINALEQIRDNINTTETKQSLTKAINKIKKELDEILKEIKTEPGMVLSKYYRLSNTKNLKGMINQINLLLEDYASAPPIAMQKGSLLEYACALAPIIARKTALKNMDDAIEKALKNKIGNKTSNIEINYNYFADDLDLNKLALNQKGYNIDQQTGTAYAYKPSQEKIDISLQWKRKVLNISAKNYNFSSGYDVHLLSKSPMIYMIQDESPIFINHYLNIVASHRGKTSIDADIKGAHDAMKMTLLFKAITGETYNRQGANLFLINDNSKKGNIKILDMSDLLNIVFTNLDSYAKVFANDQPIENLHLDNTREESGYSARITKLIMQLHQQKISASINPMIFK